MEQKKLTKTDLYTGNQDTLDYVYSIGNRISDIKLELRSRTEKAFPEYQIMLTEKAQAELMKKMIQISKVKKGIEIGTFTGYSSLCLAEGLPEDGKLVCCDVSEEFTSIAKEFWNKAGVEHKIDLIIKPAIETLEDFIKSGDSFDFAFVDADKVNYINYYEKLIKLVKKGGFIMFDNTIWKGKVAHKEINNDDKITVTINKLNRLLYDDKRIEICQVPISDGLTICYIL